MSAEATIRCSNQIASPADLRDAFSRPSSSSSSQELRQFLVRTVATRGGHFAAGLGTVELTIALHYVYETPHDRLVWDVGHQAYPHKVLTGRREQLQIHQAARWTRAVSESRRKRVRHLRHRPLEHLGQRRAGHGDRGRISGAKNAAPWP